VCLLALLSFVLHPIFQNQDFSRTSCRVQVQSTFWSDSSPSWSLSSQLETKPLFWPSSVLNLRFKGQSLMLLLLSPASQFFLSSGLMSRHYKRLTIFCSATQLNPFRATSFSQEPCSSLLNPCYFKQICVPYTFGHRRFPRFCFSPFLVNVDGLAAWDSKQELPYGQSTSFKLTLSPVYALESRVNW
jgi:hypothetical protein